METQAFAPSRIGLPYCPSRMSRLSGSQTQSRPARRLASLSPSREAAMDSRLEREAILALRSSLSAALPRASAGSLPSMIS